MSDALVNAILLSLPDLPQVRYIRHAAAVLAPLPEVRAFWIGGSFARGTADVLSDVDMRIAVAESDLGRWDMPDWVHILGETAVGHQLLRFGTTSFLHHLVLSEGTFIDFFVQSVAQPITRDAQLIVKCEDAALRNRITAANVVETIELPAVNALDLQAAVEEFWLISHKHAKVLFRNLDVLALVGIEFERAVLMRLWYARLTGRDLGRQRPTIHVLTHAVQVLQDRLGAKALALLGASLSRRTDVLQWITTVRDEISAVGRALATTHGFRYPDTLESTVRRSWAAREPLLRVKDRSDNE